MFAPDDMVEYYSGNYLLSGKYSVRLSFSNFLRNELGGDFIHCISTEILKIIYLMKNLECLKPYSS